MKPIIRVENLSKQYRIGVKKAMYGTLRDRLVDAARAPLQRFQGNVNPERETIWALRDVSFDVNQGEVLGVVGRNGAGKSTLLKVLSRITEPTTGSVDLFGRVASLLEIGTGFHPELTGRENIFLNGAMLGMRRSEIDEKFNEIVAFAELDKFLDTAVKHYSSGMYTRLAFSVAAHLEPDILIVDEVLAVGDLSFQKKCLGRMGEVAKEGRTVLFVSHNLPAIQRLCSSGIYLEAGRVKAFGEITSVLGQYQRDSVSRPGESLSERAPSGPVPENAVRFIRWSVGGSIAEMPHSCMSRETCTFIFTLACNRKLPRANISFVLCDADGQRVVVAHSRDIQETNIDIERGIHQIMWTTRLPLKGGCYQITSEISTEAGLLEVWTADPPLVVLHNFSTHLLPDHMHGLLNEPVDFTIVEANT